MKDYFEFDFAAKPVAGNHPQVSDFHRDGVSLQFLWSALQDGSWDEGLKIFPDLELASRSRVTDAMSSIGISSANGLLISRRMAELLRSFSLPKHRFLPTTVWEGRNEHQFEVFNYSSETAALNYKMSTFLDEFTDEEVEIESREHFERIRSESPVPLWLSPSRIVLSERLDWIRLPADSRVLVSADLQAEIQKRGYSGLEWKHSKVQVVEMF